MNKQAIIVSGRNGQLGSELFDIAALYPQYEFIFFSKAALDISDEQKLKEIFEQYRPSFFINAAAYTAVDKAETEQEKAYIINAEAVGHIARQCGIYNTHLIHISTDYVFNGRNNIPYKEEDICDPVNYYGYTKWLGEELALNNNTAITTVIRTSWVYSMHGNNFVKTMLRLMSERDEINVVNDQLGSPTYARDIAEVIMEIVGRQRSTVNGQQLTVNGQRSAANGIFHFSNNGIISWYDFAVAIRDIKKLNCSINPIPSSSYPTPAKRPAYSGMSKDKIVSVFNIQLKEWRESLVECLREA